MNAIDERALLYTLIHRGTPGDVDFYLQVCRGAEHVLELGCGGGRILAPLASAGHTVVGLDIDPGMVALALSALPSGGLATVIQADMRRYELPQRFDRVLIPYNGLYALETDQDIEACLWTAAHHLAEDGELWFDGYAVHDNEADGPMDADDEFEFMTTIIEGGQRIDVWDRERPTGAPRTLLAEYRFKIGSREIEQAITHHFFAAGEVIGLLRKVGLTMTGRWGDFAGTPFAPDSAQLVVSAKRTQDIK